MILAYLIILIKCYFIIFIFLLVVNLFSILLINSLWKIIILDDSYEEINMMIYKYQIENTENYNFRRYFLGISGNRDGCSVKFIQKRRKYLNYTDKTGKDIFDSLTDDELVLGGINYAKLFKKSLRRRLTDIFIEHGF